tara:strand:- start:300 stop:506 length:207 start_codon:yes stop_codon:yes gene_type:complete
MKKKMIALSLSSILLIGCGTSKPASDDCCKPKTEVVKESHNEILSNDPLMKTLGAVFIIVIVNILTTK